MLTPHWHVVAMLLAPTEGSALQRSDQFRYPPGCQRRIYIQHPQFLT